MGYTPSTTSGAPIRRLEDSGLEMPGRGRQWWEAQLASSVDMGLAGLQWHAVGPGGDRYWGVVGAYAGMAVSIRLPRPLERRGEHAIVDEALAVVEAGVTQPTLGRWVIESPPKWFRGRRAWALNRPPFATGDPWLDEHAGCWAWDCARGPQALRDELAAMLPAVKGLLRSQPGAIVTDSAVSVWIPHSDMPMRMPDLLETTRLLGEG